jgi:hypothetical protein
MLSQNIMVQPSPTIQPEARKRSSRFAVWLAAIALAFQALLPGGFMLGAKPSDGSITITLCTASGNITAIMDQNGQIRETHTQKDTPTEEDAQKHGVCIFAGHGAAFDLPSPAPTAPIVFGRYRPSDFSAAAYVAPGLGLAAPPPPQTGPPRQA